MPKRPMTVEDLWAIPRVGAPVPSPDGTRCIVPVTEWSMETNDSVTRLWLVATDGGTPPRALTQAEASSGSPAWSPDGTRVAFVRKGGARKDEKKKSGPKHPDRPQIHVIAVDGGEAERVTDLPLGAVDPRWFPDGRRIAFVAAVYEDAATPEKAAKRAKEREEDPCRVHVTEDRWYRHWDQWMTDGRVQHLWALDLDTRDLVDLIPASKLRWSPEDPSGQYEISPDGREIAFSACRSVPPHDPILWGIYTVAIPATLRAGAKPGRVALLSGTEFPDATGARYSPDGRWIAWGIQRELDFYADRMRLVAHDRRTGRTTVLTEAWDRSASGWEWSADSRTLFIRAEDRARTGLFTLDLARALRSPATAVPALRLRRQTFSAPEIAAGRAFVSLTGVRQPPEAAVIDLKSFTLRVLTAFTRPAMRSLQLSEVEETHITGAGGDPVQMWIYYPPGTKRPRGPLPAGRRLPLVHIIHGGPHGTFGDDWHWRWNPHLFAAGGYAVALVNFHGSTGWGQKFAASILGRWGDQPWYDITVATDTLIERGLVDPRRMAATGGSYGGYMAAWIASQTDRFACIVNHAGVSDLQTQYASDHTQGRARSMGGEPWDRIEGMDRWNPMRQARGFRSPMLVLHGEKDYRVPYVQGLEIYNVYKAMKLPARLVVYPEENHWILKPRTSRHWYGEVTGWLKRWLRKGAAR